MDKMDEFLDFGGYDADLEETTPTATSTPTAASTPTATSTSTAASTTHNSPKPKKFKNLSASAVSARIIDPSLAQHEAINRYLEERENNEQRKAQQHRSSTPRALPADMRQSHPARAQLKPRYSKMQQDQQSSTQRASAMSFDPIFTIAQQATMPSFNGLGLAQYNRAASSNVEWSTSVPTLSPFVADRSRHPTQPFQDTPMASRDVIAGAKWSLVSSPIERAVDMGGSRKRKRVSSDDGEVQNESNSSRELSSTLSVTDQNDDETWTPINGDSAIPITSTQRSRKSRKVTKQRTAPPAPVTTASRISGSSQSNGLTS